MAETVLGRVPSRRITLTDQTGELCRDATRAAVRRYRTAYRRADREMLLIRLRRWLSLCLAALSHTAVPIRTVAAALVYAGAGFSARARHASGGRSFHLEKPETTARKKHNHVRVNTALAFLAAGCLIFAASIYRIGLEVILDGESIGYVSSQSVVDASLANVSLRAGEVLGRPFTVSPDIIYRFSVVNRNSIYDSEGVEAGLLNSIPDIDRLCVLTVDGVAVAASWTPDELGGVLDAVLDQYPENGQTEFCQDVSVKSQLASVSLLRDSDELFAELTRTVREEINVTMGEGDTVSSIAAEHGLSVEALLSLNPGFDPDSPTEGQVLLVQKAKPFLSVSYSEQISYLQAIPYQTENVDDPNLWKGETKVVTPGVEGEELIMARQTSIDGYAPDTEITGSFIVTKPVTEVIANGTKTRDATGIFIRPYYGKISSTFGGRKIFGSYSFHYGVDFAGPIGDPVVASDGGVVVFAGTKSGYGLCVIIDHQNGYQTIYGHCSKLLVKKGDRVGQGEQIAKVGNTGRSTGPHVHFEIQVNGVAKNPMNYLKR